MGETTVFSLLFVCVSGENGKRAALRSPTTLLPWDWESHLTSQGPQCGSYSEVTAKVFFVVLRCC